MKKYTIRCSSKDTIVHIIWEGNEYQIVLEGNNIEIISNDYYPTIEPYEHIYELFIALCKIYDNYITPLNCRVKCWKTKLDYEGKGAEDWFTLGMTVTEFEGNPSQIVYYLPIKYWNLINVMTLEKAPMWNGHVGNEILKKLRKL